MKKKQILNYKVPIDLNTISEIYRICQMRMKRNTLKNNNKLFYNVAKKLEKIFFYESDTTVCHRIKMRCLMNINKLTMTFYL